MKTRDAGNNRASGQYAAKDSMKPAQVVQELIRRACARDFVGFMALSDENIFLALPTALPQPVSAQGMDQIPALIAAVSGSPSDGKPQRMYDDMEAREVRAYQTPDPNVVIVEWDFISHVDGHEVCHPNIQVTECRDGRMVHTVDYHTFVARAVANGDVPRFLDMIADMILPEDRAGTYLCHPQPAAISRMPDSSPTSPAEVVLEEIRRASVGDIAGMLELYADDIEVKYPLMLPAPVVITGKTNQLAVLERTGFIGGANPPRRYDELDVRDVRVHETTDPNFVVVQWTYVARIGDSTVVMPNIVVSECRNGKIVRATNYHDHVTRAVADGNVPACLATIEAMILPGDRG